MNWKELKESKCPKCGRKLRKSVSNLDGYYLCSSASCDFKISFENFDAMLQKICKPKFVKIPDETDNLSALNNLDLNEESDDDEEND